jgi:hypothetical protein
MLAVNLVHSFFNRRSPLKNSQDVSQMKGYSHL